jgi:CheY-like chemotaxis protein
VDDDTDDHFIIEEIINRLSLKNRLLFYRSGKEVLDYLRTTSDKPFLILSDINMPQMTGMELRKRIDADESLRKKSIPFIFFSTAASDQQVDEAYDLTVQGFFLKASGFEESAETLKLVVDYWKKCLHPNNFK